LRLRRIGGERLERGDVRQCVRRSDFALVRGREARAMAIHQACGLLGRPRGVERCLETVLPSGGGLGDLAPERGFIDGGPERGASATQGHVQACVVGERDLHLGLEVLGAAVVEQQALDA
jgi:hypothetical protein